MNVMIIRKLSTTAKLLAFALATSLGACSGEVGEQVADGVGEEVPGEGEVGDLSDKAGDSYVQWCNDPRADVGTLCRQQGCTGDACYAREAAAIAECRKEVSNICGSPRYPFYIVMKADGYYWPL